jgi:hypothetical protein
MTSGIPGSAYQPSEDTLIRLARWKRLASTGIPVDDIAAQVGMSRHALDPDGVPGPPARPPDAILHPTSGLQGLRHVYDSRGRRDRLRALRSKQGVSS